MNARMIYTLAPISGALALIYQILWQRELRLLLGSGPESFSLTVGLFLGGLSVGYYYFSEKTKSPKLLDWLIVCELLIGVFAWITSVLLANQLVSLWLALPLIFIPVFVMGAFMPLCAQLLVRWKLNSKPESRLYAVHGVGSALGAWFAGLFLLPVVGTQLTLVLSGVLHFIVAAGLYLLRPAEKEHIP